MSDETARRTALPVAGEVRTDVTIYGWARLGQQVMRNVVEDLLECRLRQGGEGDCCRAHAATSRVSSTSRSSAAKVFLLVHPLPAEVTFCESMAQRLDSGFLGLHWPSRPLQE